MSVESWVLLVLSAASVFFICSLILRCHRGEKHTRELVQILMRELEKSWIREASARDVLTERVAVQGTLQEWRAAADAGRRKTTDTMKITQRHMNKRQKPLGSGAMTLKRGDD